MSQNLSCNCLFTVPHIILVPLNSMSKSDRKTQHIAEKVRRGLVVPELKNLPTTYSMTRSMPVDCKPNYAYGGNGGSGSSSFGGSGHGNSLF